MPQRHVVSDADAALLGEDPADNAGHSVGIGDLDGDGWVDLLVGASGDTTGGSSAGAVFAQYTSRQRVWSPCLLVGR